MKALKNITWIPSDYVNAAVIANLAGQEMLNRLSWMVLQPQVILDVGCGPGSMIPKLRKCYPDAEVLAVDQSDVMITYAKQQTKLSGCICADGETLPLRDNSVNLIFANLILPWCNQFPIMLKEWLRVLHPEGVLMMSALGLDTFKELPSQKEIQAPKRVDMHDLGDLLLQFGFADPVLDVDHYTLVYNDKKHLIQELCACGVPDIAKEDELDEEENLELTYELIYAHAFLPASSNVETLPNDNTVAVPLTELRKSLKK